MARVPYEYGQHKGLVSISWDDFHGICKALTVAVDRFKPDIVLPILRGGLYPGGLLAHILRIDLHPIRLSRREVDTVSFQSPRWIIDPPAAVAGKRVLIVDEICDTGETASVARIKVKEKGAEDVRVAVLYAHSWGSEAADYIGLETNELILNPWDREIYVEDTFQMHPEYTAAIGQQGLEIEPEMLLPTSEIKLAKG